VRCVCVTSCGMRFSLNNSFNFIIPFVKEPIHIDRDIGLTCGAPGSLVAFAGRECVT